MDDADPGQLADLRAAFLSASQASMDATLDAAAIRDEPTSTDRGERLIAALHRMVELQVDTLAAHDRLIARAVELGADWQVIAQLREGRADLALGMQRTIAQVDRRAAPD